MQSRQKREWLAQKQAVTKFDRSVKRSEKQTKSLQRTLLALAKERIQILLEAKDKLTPYLNKVGVGIKSLSENTWSVTLKAVDFATAPIRSVINLLRAPALRAGAVSGSINSFKDFEAASSKVKAGSGPGAQETEQSLQKSAKKFGGAAKFTAAEAAVDFAATPISDMAGLLRNPASIEAEITESINFFKDFEAEISRVKVITGAGAQEIEQMSEKAKELGAATKFSATEAANAFTYLGAAG